MTISKYTWLIIVLGFIIACLTGLLIWSLTRPDDVVDTDGDGVSDTSQMKSYNNSLNRINGTYETPGHYYLLGRKFIITKESHTSDDHYHVYDNNGDEQKDLKEVKEGEKHHLVFYNYPFSLQSRGCDRTFEDAYARRCIKWGYKDITEHHEDTTEHHEDTTGNPSGISSFTDTTLTIGGIKFTKVKDNDEYRCENDYYLKFKKVAIGGGLLPTATTIETNQKDCFVMYYDNTWIFIAYLDKDIPVTDTLATQLFATDGHHTAYVHNTQCELHSSSKPHPYNIFPTL